MRSAPRPNFICRSKQGTRRLPLPGLVGLIGLCGTALLCSSLLTTNRVQAEEAAKVSVRDLTDLTSAAMDLSATVRVTKYESAELEKIGSDFKSLYSIRNASFQYKQPDKIRFEARSQTRGNALLILNGPVRYYAVPKLGLHKTEDLANSPGKRQSLLEFAGLLSPGTLKFMQGRYVRDETQEGKKLSVFEMRYQKEEKGQYYRVWIDPVTRLISKREWYDSADKLKATFTYQAPQEVAPDLWVPNRIEIKNAEGVTACIVTLSEIKVNQGVGEDPFTVGQ